MAQPNAQTYSVIVVDPPWAYGSDTGRPNRTAEAHYQTIGDGAKEINRVTGRGVENIAASVPVGALAGANSHLYLWATNPKLPFAFDLMKAWGFTYKTTLTWVKTTSQGQPIANGMGFFFRGATEHVLFGVRGVLPIPPAVRKPNLVMAQRGDHSVKPDEFYDLINGLYAPEVRKLDVFARRYRDGWDSHGNELPSEGSPVNGA